MNYRLIATNIRIICQAINIVVTPRPVVTPNITPVPVVTTAPVITPTPTPTPTQAPTTSRYQRIFDEYSEKLRAAAPTSSITEMAEIANEGVGKMAEYMFNATGTDGQYATYEAWAGKLMDVYMQYAR